MKPLVGAGHCSVLSVEEGSGQGINRGVMQDDGYHGSHEARRPLDRQNHGAGGFALDPVAETSQHPVSGMGGANGSGQRIKHHIAIGRILALHHHLQFRPGLPVIARRRQRHLGLAGVAIAQVDKAAGWNPLGQHLAAQDGGGQRREPRVQRGEDGFAKGGQWITM